MSPKAAFIACISLSIATIVPVAHAEPPTAGATAPQSPPPTEPAPPATPAVPPVATAPWAVVQAPPTSPLAAPAPVERVQRSYGVQIMVPDGLGAMGLIGAPGTFFIIGGAEWMFVGPFVHLGHGNPGRAGASFLLRVAGMYGYWTSAWQSTGENSTLKASVGGAVALVGVTLLDGLALANDTVAADPPRVTPTVAVTPEGAYVGATGRF